MQLMTFTHKLKTQQIILLFFMKPVQNYGEPFTGICPTCLVNDPRRDKYLNIFRAWVCPDGWDGH